MSEKAVIITLLKNKPVIIIVPESRTTIGYWLMHEPAFQVNLPCEPSMLGSVVVEALALSKQNIPPPEKHSRAFPSYLKEATGLTKWKDFEKSCTHLDLYQDEDNVLISQSLWIENAGGYLEGTGKEISLANESLSLESLGSEILNLLDIST